MITKKDMRALAKAIKEKRIQYSGTWATRFGKG